jgi:hypothetical protein
MLDQALIRVGDASLPVGSYLVEAIAEYAMRRAAGMKASRRKIEVLAGLSLARIAIGVGEQVASELVEERDGLLRCGLCKMGSLTRIGLYLHLRRKHLEEIKQLVETELEFRVRAMNKYTVP